jgi:hypothetical protein
MSIPIGIQNLTSSTLYIKEIQVEVPANQTFFINDYDFFTLAEAQSLKDAITADQAFVVRDSVVLSKADSLAYVTTPPSTLGEVNTASNVGTGDGVFKQKTGVDLEFKSFTAGTNITLTPSDNEIQINAAGGGESNTASNVGTGAGVFKQKTGVDLEMRSISSSDFDVTEGADEIEIQADPALITNKTSTTPTAGMQVLLEDSGTLKRGDVSTFLGGGGASFGFDKTKNAYYFPGTNRVDYAYRTNGTVSINQLNVIGFNIYGQVELESFSINTGSALLPNVVASIYKYDYATNNWNLVAQSTPYTTGLTGLQTYTLPSTVTMENGLYFAGLLADANASNFSGIQANGLFNAFGYATTPLNLAAVDKWFKYNLTYTATMPATISGYPTGFIRQTSGNVGLPLLRFN